MQQIWEKVALQSGRNGLTVFWREDHWLTDCLTVWLTDCLTVWLTVLLQSWAIGSWDRYSGIPVLPEVKISTIYFNTNLFKKLLIANYQKWSQQLSVVGIFTNFNI